MPRVLDFGRARPYVTPVLPPGPATHPFIQLARWMISPARSIEEMGAQWGDAFTTRNPIFGTLVNFSHPDALREIFTGAPEVFHAGEANDVLRVYIGARSVLLLDDSAHLHMRRLMLPAFHGERMRHYTHAIRETTTRALARLEDGQTLSLHALFQDVTLTVILRAVLGLTGEPLETARARISTMLRRIQSPIGMLWSMPALRKDLGPLTPWASVKREIEATDRLLHAHIAAHRRGDADPDDVLSMLVRAVDDDGSGLDDAALRDQLITLLLAGHETSATTLSWAFEELLRVEGEQDALIAEVHATLGERPVESDDLPQLPRIDSVLKEALRLHPVTGAVARRLKAPATIGGYDLPAGVLVVALLHLTHRRPELYPEPDRFVADRFIGKKIDPYAWAPFGGGARRCLGMAFAMHEMKVILATMLASGVRFSLVDRGPLETTLRSIVYAPEGATRVLVRRTHGRTHEPRESR